MSERKTVEITLVDQDSDEEGAFVFDGSIEAVIESLVAIREEVPAEYRDTTRCRFSGDRWSDEGYSSLAVTYSRPETDEEMAIRIERERRFTEESQLRREVRDREEYARLKAKYG